MRSTRSPCERSAGGRSTPAPGPRRRRPGLAGGAGTPADGARTATHRGGSLATPSPAERSAAERLLGRTPGTGRALTVRLDAVDAVLVRSGISPGGLEAAVTVL
ncbi:TIGR02679 domain-containing protein, partial [Streptomyces avidinii]